MVFLRNPDLFLEAWAGFCFGVANAPCAAELSSCLRNVQGNLFKSSTANLVCNLFICAQRQLDNGPFLQPRPGPPVLAHVMGEKRERILDDDIRHDVSPRPVWLAPLSLRYRRSCSPVPWGILRLSYLHGTREKAPGQGGKGALTWPQR